MNRSHIYIALGILGVVVLALVMYGSLGQSLFSRVMQPGEQEMEATLKITVPNDAPAGPQVFKIKVEDEQESSLLAESEEITVVVSEEGSGGGDDSGDGDSGGDDGDDGDDNSGTGGGDEQIEIRSTKTISYAPEKQHVISGSYSGVTMDEGQQAVVLAHARAWLKKNIGVTPDNYWLYIKAKHDRPGPVDLAVYANGRAWKVLRLDKADNKYRTHRIGLLRQRDFTNGKIEIAFRFLNDVYDRSNPTNKEADRNLYIETWALSNKADLIDIGTTRSGLTRSPGWSILPRLNSVMKSENIAPSTEGWKYYARRLTLPVEYMAAITSEIQLRNIMKYWRGISPNRPYGEYNF